MARKVVLHVGIPKTGTTYLQNLLWANRAALAKHGVLVPGKGQMDVFHATVTVRGELDPDNRPERERSAWPRILDAVRRWDGTAVISHEYFAAAGPEHARAAVEALRPAEVHLVVTARDYITLLPTMWQESIKMRATRGFSEFTRAAIDDDLDELWGWQTADLVAILRRWAADLPPEQVHVIPLPRRGAPPSQLWNSFAQVVGVAPDVADLTTKRANESLGMVQARVLEAFKLRLPESLKPLPERYHWVRAFFAHEILAPQNGERFGLRPEEAAALRERSKQAVRFIEEQGYDVIGDLADLLGPDPLPELPHPDDVTAEQMLESALDALAVMLDRHRSVSLERDRLRRQLRGSRGTSVAGPAATAYRRVVDRLPPVVRRVAGAARSRALRRPRPGPGHG